MILRPYQQDDLERMRAASKTRSLDPDVVRCLIYGAGLRAGRRRVVQ
jgi:hypothetical protein